MPFKALLFSEICASPHSLVTPATRLPFLSLPAGFGSFNDPLFEHSFADVYPASILPYPTLAVLGNHDYGDGLSIEDMELLCHYGHEKVAPSDLPHFASKEAEVLWSLQHCEGLCCRSPEWQLAAPRDALGGPSYSEHDDRWTAVRTGATGGRGWDWCCS